MAVDHSGRRGFDGNIFIAWHDGRRDVVADVIGDEVGTYAYSDIFILRSTDGGNTWPRVPVRVNDTVEPTPSGLGTDQFMPSVAVNGDGAVGVCWYDRRNDRFGFLIDRYCAKSLDGGATWPNVRKTARAFAATNRGNPSYDGLAADFLQRNGSFVGTYQDASRGNPDVQSVVF
jgi:hypothetical protein